MHFHPLLSLLAIATLFSFVSSQTNSTCAASDDSLMQRCVAQATQTVTACGNTDTCLCTELAIEAACFDRCPTDPASQAQQTTVRAQATQRCAGTGNAPFSPNVTSNVVISNNTNPPPPPTNSAYGPNAANNTTNSTGSGVKTGRTGALMTVSVVMAVGWMEL